MRILILGASGLIGHKLFQELTKRFGDVYGVLHRSKEEFETELLQESNKIIDCVDICDFEKLTGILHAINPDVILNCVGITKRKAEINNLELAIEVNSKFPHRLANWAKPLGKRIIHFSTDCVFDGAEGNYNEESFTTGKDAYGQTKAMGEINYDHTLTIRSSFIGRELSDGSELLEWVLAQEGKTIKGFSEAYYSGVSTIVMSRVVGNIIEHHPELSGLYQLALPEPVSKYELLCWARDAFGLNVKIISDANFVTRPTLDGSKLRGQMEIKIPSWPEMMAELAREDIYGENANGIADESESTKAAA